MRYVLDLSVALKWVLAEPNAAIAVRLRDEFRKGIHELLAPDVFPIEVAHALARAERRGAIRGFSASLYPSHPMSPPPPLPSLPPPPPPPPVSAPPAPP